MTDCMVCGDGCCEYPAGRWTDQPQLVPLVCCRHPDLSPVWSLAHLTLLTELTLSGTDSFPSWAELLRSPAEPVLPVSLVTLRQQSRDTVFFSSENRCEAVTYEYGGCMHKRH